MTNSDLEYSISQYVDGTLPPLERDALEQRLATDADARAMLAEYQRIDAAMKTSLPPMPDIDWNALSVRISAVVAQAEAPTGRNYSINTWVRAASKWAVAAVLLVAVGIGVKSRFASAPTPDAPPPLPQAQFVKVEGPQIEAASSPAVEVISIGPSDALARGGGRQTWRYLDDGVVSRPSSVAIYSTSARAQDIGTSMPY